MVAMVKSVGRKAFMFVVAVVLSCAMVPVAHVPRAHADDGGLVAASVGIGKSSTSVQSVEVSNPRIVPDSGKEVS